MQSYKLKNTVKTTFKIVISYPYGIYWARQFKNTWHYWGEVLRWWRNRTGRSLSPPQIHQKINWTLRKFHKTASECWQRTPGAQKGSIFSLKGGHLYRLPPPSLFYLTLWISLHVLCCGEHLGNWLLVRSVSLLLTPPHLLLVTSVSFLPHLFSM